LHYGVTVIENEVISIGCPRYICFDGVPRTGKE